MDQAWRPVMPAHKSRLVRVMSEEQIVDINGTLPYATSIGHHWTGVEVHRYRTCGPLQTKEFRPPQLAIFLPHVDHPVRVRQRVGDHVTTKDVRNDAVTIAPAALTRQVSSERPYELTAIFLDPLVFSDVAHGETVLSYPEIPPQFAISDPLIRSVGMTLDGEMQSNNPKPSFYAERLASILASHIVLTYSGHGNPEMRGRGPHWAKLRRCIEYIQANIDQPLPLDELATIAGMSKFHFAKSFSQAMGIPPHQYLVQARMQKAKGLLSDETMSVEQIASRVGYSDIGQFSVQFLKLMGLSPARYRRHVRQP
jgi:AraC family transcriptional regulator